MYGLLWLIFTPNKVGRKCGSKSHEHVIFVDLIDLTSNEMIILQELNISLMIIQNYLTLCKCPNTYGRDVYQTKLCLNHNTPLT